MTLACPSAFHKIAITLKSYSRWRGKRVGKVWAERVIQVKTLSQERSILQSRVKGLAVGATDTGWRTFK